MCEAPGAHESTLPSSGNFSDAPVPQQFARVSKKSSRAAKRAMTEGYSFDTMEEKIAQGQRFAASRVQRGQLGAGVHEMWMKDIIKTCGAKGVFFLIMPTQAPRCKQRQSIARPAPKRLLLTCVCVHGQAIQGGSFAKLEELGAGPRWQRNTWMVDLRRRGTCQCPIRARSQ